MKYSDTLKLIKELEFDKKTVIYTDGKENELYVVRPSKLPKTLKNSCDVKKNVQIWLRGG